MKFDTIGQSVGRAVQLAAVWIKANPHSALLLIIAAALAISIVTGALTIARALGRRALGRAEQVAEPAQTGARRSIARVLGLLGGPLPISIALHAAVLLILIGIIREQTAPAMIVISLSGSGIAHPDDALPALPQMATPDTAPQDVARVPLIRAAQTAELTNYVRAVDRGAFSNNVGVIGRGYGQEVGVSFGGYIGLLRRQGLDVALVIDGTGSMQDVIGDVRQRMEQLVLAIHRLVPTARIAVVEFGGRGDPIEVHPFTLSPAALSGYLNMIQSRGGGEWQEDTLGGIRAAVEQLQWRPSAKKVIVLVGDTPPFDEDMPKVLSLIDRFREEDGTFNTVDVTVEEHERFQRELYYSMYHKYPKKISPLQGFYLQTQAAYKAMAAQGDGEWRSLTRDAAINQQVLILAFGRHWQSQVAAFGVDIAPARH